MLALLIAGSSGAAVAQSPSTPPAAAGPSAAAVAPSTAAVAPSTAAVAPSAPAVDLQAPIPIDSAVTIGRLANGMTYYVRPNGWPEDRIELRLAVAAGSVQEEDDQQGLAHFVEHMAFNGSTHFPPGELVRYFESIGARFGADLNAYTDYDETVYKLSVPADRPEAVDRGLTVLADFASGVAFAAAEIDKERGVVLEEWRLSRGAAERLSRIIDPVLFHGSRYADRNPIGLPEIIQHAPPARIRAFYTTWYRPERMAICIVGDIDRAAAVGWIRAHFQSIPASKTPVETPVYEIPPHTETLQAIATDPEARFSTIAIVHKRPLQPLATLGDLRRSFARSLLLEMLNDRFRELARIADAPFLNASAGPGTLGKTVRTFRVAATVPDGHLDTGLRALVIETRRAREYGFGVPEIERAKADLRANYERAYNERERSESAGLASRYVAHFLDHDPIPSLEDSYRLASALLPGIELDDLRAALDEVMPPENRVVVAQAPKKPDLAEPTAAGLQAVFAAAESTKVSPWRDLVADRPLLDPKPKLGKVVSRRRIPALGAQVLGLSNGAQVWLRPSDFKKDQIVFAATARGGASVVDPKQYPQALQAASIVRETGVGGFTPVEITKLLSGKLVGVGPTLGAFTHGVSGSSTPKDLETALQLLYLDFTAPTPREAGVEVVKKQLRTTLANRANDPETAFFDAVRAVNSRNHYMAKPLQPADVEALRLGPTLEFWKRCFGNAADFDFFFVGAFDTTTIEPLILSYIGSLPSKGTRRSNFHDRAYRFPDTNQALEVRKGQEPKSRTAMTFFADPGTDIAEIERARAAADLLEIRLREILREDLGTTYSVGVGFSSLQPVPGYGTMTIAFGSAPENRDRMVDTVLAEIGRLQREGPAVADVAKIQEIDRRELEVAEKQNNYWLGSLQNAALVGWDPLRIADRRQRIDGLDVATLQASLVKYFPLDRRTLVSLFPEAGTPPANSGE
jgi:zinc protease